MAITGIVLRLVELGLREPFAAAHGEVAGRRPLVVVELHADEGRGWGECEALPEAGYTTEWAAGAFAVLRDQLAPRLLGVELSMPAVAAVLRPDRHRHPMAVAALEVAAVDAVLRAEGRSLARWLGAERPTVPAGAVVGLAPDVAALEARVGSLVESGYARVKVKIGPGWDVEPLRALRSAFPDLELQADANGAYGPGEVGALAALEPVGLSSLEQPLAPADLRGAADLRRRLAVPIAADEAAATPADVEAVLAAGAADLIVVKPARLGGLGAARRVHDRCRHAGVGLVAGGLVEAGLGRRVLAAVAALPGFTVTGDCAPAQRWLTDDPWPAEDLVDGQLVVHHGPGVAPEADLDRLEDRTRARAVVQRR